MVIRSFYFLFTIINICIVYEFLIIYITKIPEIVTTEAAIAVQQVKPLLRTATYPIRALIALLPIQLSANTPGKAMEKGLG